MTLSSYFSGTYILTAGLMPILEKSQSPAVVSCEVVVIVSSNLPSLALALPCFIFNLFISFISSLILLNFSLSVPSLSPLLPLPPSSLSPPPPSLPHQITVSSGGMYTEKLDSEDLNFESRKDKFDGRFAYGQNKVSSCIQYNTITQ